MRACERKRQRAGERTRARARAQRKCSFAQERGIKGKRYLEKESEKTI